MREIAVFTREAAFLGCFKRVFMRKLAWGFPPNEFERATCHKVFILKRPERVGWCKVFTLRRPERADWCKVFTLSQFVRATCHKVFTLSQFVRAT